MIFNTENYVNTESNCFLNNNCFKKTISADNYSLNNIRH